MAKLHIRVWHLLLVGLLFTPCLHITGPLVVSAQGEDDEVMGEGESVTMGGGGEEEEEDDMEVEDEEEDDEPVKAPDVGDTAVSDEEDDEGAVEEEEEEEEEEEFAPHPDCQSTILFTNRHTEEFVAGEVVEAVIGLTNTNKEKEFIVTLIEGSFRYPQDFSYFIQNFSVIYYETYIMPETQASFVYSFRPSESFYARPFGLTINVYYKDAVSCSTTVSSHTHTRHTSHVLLYTLSGR
ncbi:Translocon-associated protein subunit alpha [Geodia barretti]|uniref:Translocon-associated protein subunit alpha n=1 Tax=Geodia barretti TaxID=519541 RepID=A0AA35W7K9_GEOBA|nr:Translocon-associated protein subunit alpha [Geodia barretti]